MAYHEHLKPLQAARDLLVAERRNAAEELAKDYKRGHTERMRELFVSLQQTIDAIDRAIADETSLEGGRSPTSGS